MSRTLHSLVRQLHRMQQARCFGDVSGRVGGSKFGSIQRSDIPIEKPLRPRRFQEGIPREKKMKQLIFEPVKTKISKSSSLSYIECSNEHFTENKLEDGRLRLFTKYWEKNKYKNCWIRIKKSVKQAKQVIPSAVGTWNDLVPDLLHPQIAQSLRGLGFSRPTEMQSRMMRYISSPNHLFLAAETGSGKTVSYAAPILSQLAGDSKRGQKAVICAATGILAKQTAKLLRRLAEKTSIEIREGSSDLSEKAWDVLVGTPGLVANILKKTDLKGTVSYLVLDEADVLLDESFVDFITDILSLVPVAYSETNANRFEGAKVIFCSASCPEELECLAEGVVNRRHLSYVKSHDLHRIVPSVDITLIRTREADKMERLLDLLKKDIGRGKLNQTVVFCKNQETAKFVHKKLNSLNCPSYIWERSTSDEDIQKARIIVTTDGASRGIDLPRLNHVVHYDMSRYLVDFLHRSGRVGRLSSLFPCHVTAFVRTAEEVRISTKIELAARLQKPLHSIETDIAGMMEKRRKE